MPKAKPHPQLAINCLWIDGDISDPDWHYCQKKIAAGQTRPWCPKHLPRVYRPAADVRQDQAAYREAQARRRRAVDTMRLTFGSV